MSGFECSRYAFYSQSIENPYTLQGDNNLLNYVDDSLYTEFSDEELLNYVPKPGDIIGYKDLSANQTNRCFGCNTLP